MPTGPKLRDKEKHGKDAEKDKRSKDSDKSVREPLAKPNSIVADSVGTKSKAGYRSRRADTVPSWKSSGPRDLSPLSRKGTSLTQITDDLDAGLYETTDEKKVEEEPERAKSAGYVNPNPWKIPLKVDDPPYVQNLGDDYPRDEYTMMPLVDSAPKYFDGRHGPRLYKKDVKPGSVDTKKKLRKANLPKEVVDKVMSGDATLNERPVLFKPRHIHDVQVKKKYDDEVKPKSEVSLHLCDDMSSFLFKNSLKKAPDVFSISSTSKAANRRQLLEMSNSILSSHPDTRSTTTSNWSSVKFPREKVLQTMHVMTKPDIYPAIRGDEFSVTGGQMSV